MGMYDQIFGNLRRFDSQIKTCLMASLEISLIF